MLHDGGVGLPQIRLASAGTGANLVAEGVKHTSLNPVRWLIHSREPTTLGVLAQQVEQRFEAPQDGVRDPEAPHHGV